MIFIFQDVLVVVANFDSIESFLLDYYINILLIIKSSISNTEGNQISLHSSFK